MVHAFSFFKSVGLLFACLALVGCSEKKSSSSNTSSSSENSTESSSTSSKNRDGRYRISLDHEYAVNEEGGYIQQIAYLEFQNGKGTFNMTEPVELEFQGDFQVSDEGSVEGSGNLDLGGDQPLTLELKNAKLVEGTVQGQYLIRIGDHLLIEGTLQGMKETDEDALVAGSDITGRFEFLFKRQNESTLKACIDVNQGHFEKKVSSIIHIEGLVTSSGDVIIVPHAGTSSSLSGTGTWDEANQQITGPFKINQFTGSFEARHQPDCEDNTYEEESIETSQSASQANSRQQRRLNSEDADVEGYALCSISDIRDNPLTCRPKECNTRILHRERQLDDLGNGDDTFLFTSEASCEQACKALELQPDPESNMVEQLLGFGDSFGICEPTEEATDDTDGDDDTSTSTDTTQSSSGNPTQDALNARVNGPHLLCSQRYPGDNPLICMSQREGCNSGVVRGSILDENGNKNQGHVFDNFDACLNACDALEFEADPNATTIEEFTGVGDKFGTCRTPNEKKEHILCARVYLDPVAVSDSLYCKPKTAGCLPFKPSIPLEMQIVFSLQSYVMQIDAAGEESEDYVFEDLAKCNQSCDLLSNTNIPFAALDKLGFFALYNLSGFRKDFGNCHQ